MKSTLRIAAVAVVFSGAVLIGQGFNIRPGTWEYTITMEGVMGGMDMSKIPPAMRAQMEAEMHKPRTVTSCITAADIKAVNLGKSPDEDEDSDCKTVSSKITPMGADVVRQCTGDNPRTETSHFEALSPQSLRGTVTSKGAQGTGTIKMTGKWLAAQCKD